MTQEAILAFIRHGLTLGGGALVSSGLASDGEIATTAGAIVAVIGFAWSLHRKWANKTRMS